MKLVQLIDTVIFYSFESKTGRSKALRQSSLVNIKEKVAGLIILPFHQNHKRVWNRFQAFTIEVKTELEIFPISFINIGLNIILIAPIILKKQLEV